MYNLFARLNEEDEWQFVIPIGDRTIFENFLKFYQQSDQRPMHEQMKVTDPDGKVVFTHPTVH